jgi:hypothetical protein
MSSRSERYLANAEKCQRCTDVANTSGPKRLYGMLASQWRQLAEEADWTDKIGSGPLLDKIRQAHFLRQIDKAEGAIRKVEVALEGEPSLNSESATSIVANGGASDTRSPPRQVTNERLPLNLRADAGS